MIGDRIKALREKLKLTQEQLSQNIGINVNTIASYERNIREPKLDTVVKFCNYFNVPSDYLLGLVDNIKRENVDVSQKYGLTDRALECLEIIAKAAVKASTYADVLRTINILLEQHFDSITEFHSNTGVLVFDCFADSFAAHSSGESVLDCICQFLSASDESACYIVEADGTLTPMSEYVYERDCNKSQINRETIKNVRLLCVQKAVDELKKQIDKSKMGGSLHGEHHAEDE